MVPPWSCEAPNHGFHLRGDGAVVGAALAFYSDRVIDGRTERVCNLGAWCVADEHRSQGLRLLRALLGQRGYHFTDLSPSGNVVALNERLRFEHLDTTTAVVPNLPRPAPRRTAGHRPRAHRGGCSTGAERRIFEDHRAPPRARHVVLEVDGGSVYVMFRKDRRKGLPVFATLLHVSDPTLLPRVWGRLARPTCCVRHGAAGHAGRGARPGWRPAGRSELAHPRPKMFRSDALAAERHRLPVQRADVRGLVSGDSDERRRTMRTRVHHLLEEAAARHPQRPALTAGGTTATYAEAWREVRRLAAGLATLGLARGDRVAVYLDKRIETVTSHARRLRWRGQPSCPVNPVLKPRQVAHVLADSGAAVLVTTARALGHAVGRARRRRPAPRRARRRRCPTRRTARTSPCTRTPTCCSDAATTGAERPAARPGHGGHPLHLRQHRPAQGRRAQPPQPPGRGGEREHLPGQHRRRRDPGGAAAQLRRRAEPGDHRVERGCPRRARQLPRCLAT